MRRFRHLAVLVVALAACIVARPADAGVWNWIKPTPLVNHLNRFVGVGWSDGYHAYGSRNSWAKPPKSHQVPHAMPGTTWHAVPTMTMPYERIEPPEGVPQLQPQPQLQPAPAR